MKYIQIYDNRTVSKESETDNIQSYELQKYHSWPKIKLIRKQYPLASFHKALNLIRKKY